MASMLDSYPSNGHEGADVTESQKAGILEGLEDTIEFYVSENSSTLCYSDTSSLNGDALDDPIGAELDTHMAMRRSSSAPTLRSLEIQPGMETQEPFVETQQPGMETPNQEQDLAVPPEPAPSTRKSSKSFFKWPSLKRRGSTRPGSASASIEPKRSFWASRSAGGSARGTLEFHAVSPVVGTYPGTNSSIQPSGDQEGEVTTRSSAASRRFRFRGWKGSFYGKTRVVAFDPSAQ